MHDAIGRLCKLISTKSQNVLTLTTSFLKTSLYILVENIFVFSFYRNKKNYFQVRNQFINIEQSAKTFLIRNTF